MKEINKPILILIAEDDAEDRMLLKDAMDESRLANEVRFVEDGEELLDYLHNKGKYTDKTANPLPGLIMLDLNMPKMDGREALREIKKDMRLRIIPIVVLTTSQAEEDVLRSYDLGVSSFITKPVTFVSMVDIMKVMGRYWFEIVELPGKISKSPTP